MAYGPCLQEQVFRSGQCHECGQLNYLSLPAHEFEALVSLQ